MMALSNLPPGVSVSDIPGNRPIDALWDKLYEVLSRCYDEGITLDEVKEAFEDVALEARANAEEDAEQSEES
jgi:hypothetical protein